MPSAKDYTEIVKWSYEDDCYVGMAPTLFTGGCHGPDERAVYDELCEIVDEVVAIHVEDGMPFRPTDPPHITEVADRFTVAMRERVHLMPEAAE